MTMRRTLVLFSLLFALACQAQERISYFDAAKFSLSAARAMQYPCTSTANVSLQVPPIGDTSTWGICLNNDIGLLDTLLGGSSALQAGTASPSVLNYSTWVTANTSSQQITNFSGGFPGQVIHLICGAGDTFTTISSATYVAVGSTWTCGASSPSISFALHGSVWTEIGRAGGSSGGGGAANPASPVGSLQFNADGTSFGGSALVYNSADSSGTVCPTACASFVTTASAGLILQSSDGTSIVGMYAVNDSGSSGGADIFINNQTVNIPLDQGIIGIIQVGGNALGGNCFSSSVSSPTCSSGVIMFVGDNPTDTHNGQDVVGYTFVPQLVKTAGHNVNNVAGFLMLSASNVGAITNGETANNFWVVEVQNMFGIGTLQTVGIHVEPQTNPGPNNWAMKVEPLGGPIGTQPSNSSQAGLNVAPGIAPGSPRSGDVWFTSSALFAQVGSSTIQLAGTTGLPVGYLSPGNNGQCVIQNGSTPGWGSCAGTAGVQLLGIPNTTASTVNASSSSVQLFAAACNTTPCVPSGALNSVGKTFDVEAWGTSTFVNTSETVLLGLTVGTGTGMMTTGVVPSNTGSAQWHFKATCMVSASQTIFCTGTAEWHDAAGANFNAFGTITLTPVFLNVPQSPQVSVQFGTASASNSATQSFALTHQQN